MSNPLVTINILNFNRLHKLQYCLPSLIQTASHQYDNWELSVTDNCSTDGCVEWLRKQFKAYKNGKQFRIRVLKIF